MSLFLCSVRGCLGKSIAYFLGISHICARHTGVLRGQRPISFLEKKPGKEKKERGTSRSPLHSPPKGRPFMGPPILPGYNAFRIGGKPGIGHAALWKYRRSRMKAGMRFGGVQRGVSPLWAFFPTAFFAKKAVPCPGRTPARRGQNIPARPGRTCYSARSRV